jgi:O-antigen/teichoic acid export membrane protein
MVPPGRGEPQLSGLAEKRGGRIGVRLARNAALTFGAGCVAAIAQAAGSIIAARILGPEAYGRFGLLLWIVSVASIATALGLPITLVRHLAEARHREDAAGARGLAGRSIRLVLLVSVAAAAALSLLAPLGVRAFRDSEFALPARLAAAAVPAVALVALLRAALAGLDRYAALTRVTAFAAPIQLALVVLGAMSGLGTAGVVLGFASAQALAVILLLGALRATLPPAGPERGTRPASAGPLGPAVRRYAGVALAIGLLDAIVWQRSELFFLGRLGEPGELGRYSVAFGFSAMVTALVPGAFAAVLLPLFSEASPGRGSAPDGGEAAGRLFAASLRWLGILALPIAAGGAALSAPIVRLVLGDPYAGAAAPLAILLAGAAAGAIGGAGSALLYGAGRHGAILAMSIAGAGLDVALSLLLIPRGGAAGAAIASTVTQIAVVFAGVAYVRGTRTSAAPLPLASLARVAASAAGMGAMLFLLSPLARGLVSLAALVAIGAIAYAALLVFMRGVESADIQLARRIGERLPPGPWLRIYGACVDAIERMPGITSRGGRL